MRSFVLLGSVLSLLGCQPPVAIEPDAGTPVADAGIDAGLLCPARTHELDGACASEIVWVAGAAGPRARDHHGTWLWQGDGASTLVVIGGVDMHAGIALQDAKAAKLDADGQVVGWSTVAEPLFWQSGMGLDARGDRAYLVSGITLENGQTATTPRVQSLSMNADGTTGAWREEKPLPGNGRFHITATRVGDWLFAMGGRTATGLATGQIWRAHIGDDGLLGDWAEARAFPRPRTHHASFAVGNRLYLSGGFDASDFTSEPSHHRDVLTATVDAQTGELSEWSTLPLPWDLSTHSASVMDGSVYLVGGFDGALNLLALVRRAEVRADGTLGPFVELTPLPQARAHVHHTPMAGGRLYSFGGNIGNHEPSAQALVGFIF